MIIEEQEKIMNSTGKNIIVSASAGSGKTTIMIRKILQAILHEKVHVRDILVLTYTKAAAEEMRQRLESKIFEQVKDNESLLDEIDDLKNANICTIDSFFQKLCKKYFYILKIEPTFSVVDEILAERLKKEAFELVLHNYREHFESSYKDLVSIFNARRDYDNLFENVCVLFDFLNTCEDGEAWKKHKAFTLFDNEEMLKKIINQNLCGKLSYFCMQLKTLLEKSSRLGCDKASCQISDCLVQLEKIKSEANLFENFDVLNQITLKKLAKDDSFIYYEEFSKLKQNIAKFIKEEKEKIVSKDILSERLEKERKTLIALLEFENIFENEYSKIKAKNNLLDFFDLSKNALIILEATGKEVSKNFSRIFLDEYQDANPLQEKILKKLSECAARFIVGDVKQSIYSFRQSNPDVFLKLEQDYSNLSNAESDSLNCNFRTNKHILNFVNKIFDVLMTKETCGIDYKNNCNFISKSPIRNVSGLPSVCVDILKKEEKIKNIASEIYSVKNDCEVTEEILSAQKEGILVASRIASLLGQKICENGIEREIEYKDITILLASRGNYLGKFCESLSRMGVPFFANTNASLLDNNEVKTVFALLETCNNFCNDISLVSTMLEFGGFSHEDLREMRRENESERQFYDVVLNCAKETRFSKKINEFFDMIKNLKFQISVEGVYKTLSKFLSEYLMRLSQYRVEDFECVSKFINNFLTNGYDFELSKFLLLDESTYKKIEAPNYSSGNNCVTVTTMHASKGLEFPIVFLVNLGASFNKKPSENDIKLDVDLGAGLKNVFNGQSYVCKVIDLKKNKDSFLEKVRLFYVALTRAKNHLFLCGTASKDFIYESSSYGIYSKSSYLELVLCFLKQELLEKINTKLDTFKILDDCEINTISFNSEKMCLKVPKFQHSIEVNERVNEVFEDYFKHAYMHADAVKVARKNSVTSIMQEEEYTSNNYAPNKFLLSEHLNQERAELGIIYHSILEKMNFSCSKQDLYNYVKQNKSKGELWQQVDVDNLFDLMQKLGKIKQDNKIGKILKEQKFMMQMPLCEICNSDLKEKVLIQGIIDCVMLGEKNIIIDYKYSQIKNENALIKKYKTQLEIYKLAVEKALNISVSEVFIAQINTGKIIKIKK